MNRKRSSGKTQKIQFLGTKEHMRQGLSLFEEGRYRPAIEHFELVLLHDKDNVRAYNNLGYVYQKLGEYGNALEIWEQGLKVDPSYRRIQKNIRELRQRLKRDAKEKADFPIPQQVEIGDFVHEIDWLSNDAELIELRESRFFETYLIEDSESRYVLKSLRRILSGNPSALRSFERACSDWLRLGPREYVIEARSLETVLSRPFLSLEYAPEGSLRSLLEKGWSIASPEYGSAFESEETLSLHQIMEFAVQLCIGLHTIHSTLGVAHGDVRPENILLYRASGAGRETPSGFRLKITNVGLWSVFAKGEVTRASDGDILPEFAGEGLVRTKTGFTTSSLAWCAPELLESASAPALATDVYSFGVVLYEILTGMLPFSGASPDEILSSIKNEPSEHPSTINARIPHHIGNIAMRCIMTNPADRYSDFFEIGEAIIQYIAASRAGLENLADICRRFKKISKLRFREEESGEDMMIVGGTEFSSDISQIWEILQQSAERGNDHALRKRLSEVERALSLPGHMAGEVYPTLSSITSAMRQASPEHYCEELTRADEGKRRAALESHPAERHESVIEVAFDAPESPSERVVTESSASLDDVFGPSMAERFSSLLIIEDVGQANRMLAKAMKLRAEMLLLRSPDATGLLEAFGEIAWSDDFDLWLHPIFSELPNICDCPDGRNFLENGMDCPDEIMAAVCALIFMMGEKFSQAQETLNMIPDSRYLQALNLCIWAMAKFQSPQMEKIRRNSLKSATGLLREGILAEEKSEKRSTVIFSSHPGSRHVDSYFLRGLIFEQLGEHKHSISNFRECKRILRSGERLYPNVGPWANLVQGKSLFDMDMPSEAFIRWKRTLMHELRSPWFAFLELGKSKPRELLASHVLQSCDEALSRYAESSLLWCIKGKLLACLRNHEEMLECVTRALKAEKGYAPAYFLKMEALALSDRFCDALESLKVCALRQPHEPIFMLREAEILCKLGEHTEALHELRKAIGHGLDLSELAASIESGRLDTLEKFKEFSEILHHLELG